MNDFNLMMAKKGVYTINYENGKFVFFATNSANIYEALRDWKNGANNGIYPQPVQGSFIIQRMSSPVPSLRVYVLCRRVPGRASNIDIITWEEVTV